MRLALISLLALGACATAPTGSTVFDGQATARLGQTVSIGDVHIRPLEVTEDSRCPVEVQCIHAGYFRVRVDIQTAQEHRTEVMELNRGLALSDARSLRLTAAAPARSQERRPARADYRLTFTLGPGD